MTKAGLTGMAHQHHQSKPGNRQDQHVGKFAKQVVAEEERCRKRNQRQQPVQHHVTLVLEQADVLLVIRFEMESHGRLKPSSDAFGRTARWA